MKNIIAILLCSALAAAPAFAADAAKSKHKHGQWSEAGKDDCDSKHDKAGHHEGGMGMMEGHGMMGGHGMGDPYGYDKGGVMGGMGGMMMSPGQHLLRGLDLSAEQQRRVNAISDELRHNNWVTQGQINDETNKLRDLYQAEKRDPAAIGKEYQKVFDLKRQMIETYLEAENRIEEVLTPEQRAQVKGARGKMRHMYENHMMH